MVFRIIKYLDGFKPQVRKYTYNGMWLEEDWQNIGLSVGYATVDEAKNCCNVFKEATDNTEVVEVFEL